MPKNANPFRVEALPRAGRRRSSWWTTCTRPSSACKRDRGRRRAARFVHPFEGPLTALGTAHPGAGARGAGAGPRRGHRPHRRRRAVRGRGGGGEARAAALPGVRRRARGRRHHAPQLRRRLAPGHRRGAHHRRQPRRAPRRALQLRASAGATWTSWCSWTTTRCAGPCGCSSISAKLAVEPAGAAATAALCGPLRERLRGQARGPDRLRRQHRRRDVRGPSRRGRGVIRPAWRAWERTCGGPPGERARRERRSPGRGPGPGGGPVGARLRSP